MRPTVIDTRDAVTCQWQTAYGLPWTEYCGADKPYALPYCSEHTQELRENYE